jgi:RHS repeat-associated protein
VRGGIIRHDRDTTFAFDPLGNLVQRTEPDGGQWTYAWNGAGMLTKVTRPDGLEVTFTYDALGRRVTQKSGAAETRWIWDGDVILHELHSDRPPDTWYHEPESFTPLAKATGGRTYHVVADHLGTPTALYEAAGEVAWEGRRDVFGTASADESWNVECPIGWPGQYDDAETGLTYNGFRYYDPARGSYLSQDPLGISAGLRIYSYVSDVQTWIDPFGLSGCRKASEMPVLRPGSPAWRAAVQQSSRPGKGKDFRVANEAQARALLRESRGEMPQFPTYTEDKYQRGFEVHPNESHTRNAPHNDLPHIMWKDWSVSPKALGARGHIFFGE